MRLKRLKREVFARKSMIWLQKGVITKSCSLKWEVKTTEKIGICAKKYHLASKRGDVIYDFGKDESGFYGIDHTKVPRVA